MKIGTDIVEIKRVDKLLNSYGNKFKDRFLSKNEIIIAKKIETIAGFWAAKEAVSKALGCGIGAKLSFHDILLSKDNLGSPLFTLSKKAKKVFNIEESSLSISHDGGFAIAVVVIKLNKQKD